MTGFVLAVLAIWASFGFSNVFFGLLCALVISMAAWEWSGLYLKTPYAKAAYIIGFWILAYISYWLLLPLLAIALIWWVIATILLMLPMEKLVWLKRPVSLTIIGYLLLVPAWVCAVHVHEYSRLVIFTLIMFVCFADTGAYFIGFKYGKTKLAPILSPKKTVAGLWGGIVVGAIAGMAMVVLMPDITWAKAILWLILGIFIILVSVIGDLFESLIKRICDTKDSGSLLPGHGGILDRVDSLCAALPIYAIFVLFIMPH